MSHLTYTSYEGYGQRSKTNLWYSQAVCVGDIVECAGQGGWDRETDKIEREIVAQIEKAFDNVEHNLKLAGCKGWENVFFHSFTSPTHQRRGNGGDGEMLEEVLSKSPTGMDCAWSP